MSLHWSDVRLLLVGPLPPPSGGMAMQTLQLADLIRREGGHVELLQTNPPYSPTWLGRVRGLRAVGRLLPYLARLWRATARADLVHVMANSGLAWWLFAAPAIRIARFRNRPTIVNYRGGGAVGFLEHHSRSIRSLLRRAHLVVPSGFLVDAFARHRMTAEIVPNIVDLELFQSSGALPDELHVVVTRNLEPVYDLPTALEAFRQVRDRVPGARMTIAGSGPERGALEKLAEDLGVAGSVTFAGRLDRADVAALYRRASIALNPSRVDNMPNSVLEAMAAGVPMVSTNVGGVPYLVTDRRTALLVPAGDAVAMAAAMLELHGSPVLRARLRAQALAEVQRYGWPEVREQWLGVYGKALATQRIEGGAQ